MGDRTDLQHGLHETRNITAASPISGVFRGEVAQGAVTGRDVGKRYVNAVRRDAARLPICGEVGQARLRTMIKRNIA